MGDNVAYSGWMTKQGGLIKNWKKRWFVLRKNGDLDYYLDKSMKKKKGTLNVKGITCTSSDLDNVNKKKTNRGYLFAIETTFRTFLMYADTQADFNQWKEKLVEQGAKWKGVAAKNSESSPKVNSLPEKNGQDVNAFYELGEDLGSGAFSKVKRATHKKTGEKLAVKIIEKKLVDEEDLIILSREIEIMKRLDHPNVLKLKEVFENKQEIALVMELINGGELFYKIVEKGSYSEVDASSIIRQTIEGVHYLHEQGIAHRDLKPENLLCSEDPGFTPYRIVIADFGLSKSFQSDNLETSCGTPEYVAPEVISAEGTYDKQVDMWSIGVITYVLLCGFSPFFSSTQTALFQKILKVDYSFPNPEWSQVSEQAKDFIRKLLVKDPHKRATPADCLKHPWLNGGGNKEPLSTQTKLTQYNESRAESIRQFRESFLSEQ
jgi:calcium/calmodulin-dependent protein kinase I